MNIANLEAYFYQTKVKFVHFSPTVQEADEAKKAFINAVDPIFCAKFSDLENFARFTICTLQTVNQEHVPVVIIDNADRFDDRTAFAEVPSIPSNVNGHNAMIIRTSS